MTGGQGAGDESAEAVCGVAKLLWDNPPPAALCSSGRSRKKSFVQKPPPRPSAQGSKRKASAASGSGHKTNAVTGSCSNKATGASTSSTPAASSSATAAAGAAAHLDSEAAGAAAHLDSEEAPAATTISSKQSQGEETNGEADDDVVILDENPKEVGKRKKRCTSIVWQYFEKYSVEVDVGGVMQTQLWGRCKFPRCKAHYRAETWKGTTGFLNHLKTVHSIEKGQQQLSLTNDLTKNTTVVEPYRYDSENSLRKLYLAIIMHEYPFNIIEHQYFVEFIKSLRPSFPMKSRCTARKDIMDIYLEERDKLYASFKKLSCRFSATMDMWTSCQNKSYMCVTLHWIDDDWKIQKRIVGFFYVEGSHTGQKLSETFTELMVKWYVEKKLFALTLDNASANEVAVNDIIADLNGNNASLVCDGLFFHVRCACHILNLVARDGMAQISATIGNIKKLVLAVKGSPQQWEELMKCAAECGLETSKGIALDVSTRWNSTYMMLRDALYYKPAFLRLKLTDRRRYESITPCPNEWSMALKVFQCLKKFYDLTELLSGTSYPTANMFFRGFCEIKDLLDKWMLCEDTVITGMAAAMSTKFEKYWSKSSTILAVACFLDPRYKKRLIEFYMTRFYGPLGQVKVDEFLTVVTNLIKSYMKTAPTNDKVTIDEPLKTDDLLMETEDDELDRFLYDTSATTLDDLSELEKYMAAPLLKHSGGQFDVLLWWKDHSREYPILSQVARDVMAVPVSTVASESAFSAGGRVIDPYRSRLDPEMVQALICTKDWVAASRKDSKHVPSLVDNLDVLEDFVTFCKPKDDEELTEEEENDPDDMMDLEAPYACGP